MKVLLLSGVPPCTNLTAGLVLDKLCRALPRDSLACFAVLPEWLEVKVPEDLAYMPLRVAKRPQERAFRPLPGRLGEATAFLRESHHRLLPVRRLIDEAVSFGREWGAEALWCVLEGQTLIRMAKPVADKLGIPLYTQVWDPPGWWMRSNQVDRISAAEVLAAFDQAVASAEACATASWAMAANYGERYETRTVPLLPGLDAALARPPAEVPHAGDEWVIGMAGQLYADEEWNALIEALQSVDWVVAGRKVRIELLGRTAHLKATGATRIFFRGWASQADTIRLMSACDILYCPYWFDPVFEEEARLSFPAKLTTYLAAGRPVLFHGPAYASPGRFLQEHGAGELCGSLEKDEILASLTRLLADQAHYRSLSAKGSDAFHRFLTLEAMEDAFRRFLAIKPQGPPLRQEA